MFDFYFPSFQKPLISDPAVFSPSGESSPKMAIFMATSVGEWEEPLSCTVPSKDVGFSLQHVPSFFEPTGTVE